MLGIIDTGSSSKFETFIVTMLTLELLRLVAECLELTAAAGTWSKESENKLTMLKLRSESFIIIIVGKKIYISSDSWTSRMGRLERGEIGTDMVEALNLSFITIAYLWAGAFGSWQFGICWCLSVSNSWGLK